MERRWKEDNKKERDEINETRESRKQKARERKHGKKEVLVKKMG